jgi:hypothetical protein
MAHNHLIALCTIKSEASDLSLLPRLITSNQPGLPCTEHRTHGICMCEEALPTTHRRPLHRSTHQVDHPWHCAVANFRHDVRWLGRSGGVGMAAAQHEINDPAPETWETAHQAQQIEVLILMADNDEAYLLRQARQLIDAAQTVVTVLTVEHGRVM